MKVRQGFVSNSSSSSFIIAVRTGLEVGEDLPVRYDRVRNFLQNILQQVWGGDLITTKEQLDEYFVNQYCWRETDTIEKLLEEEWIREDYDKTVKALEDGFTICTLHLDYHEPLYENINLLEDGIDFRVLQGGE